MPDIDDTRVRWKAVIADYELLETFDDDEEIQVCLTARQIALISAAIIPFNWRTRWENLPQGYDIDAWISAINGKLNTAKELCGMSACCCDCGDTIITITTNNQTAINTNIALVAIYNGNPAGWLPDITGTLTPAQQAVLDDYICTAIALYLRATIRAIEASINETSDSACDGDSWFFKLTDGVLGIAQDAFSFVNWSLSNITDINGWIAPLAKSAEGWSLISGLMRDTLNDVFGGDACEVQVMPMGDDAINQYVCQIRDALIGQPLTFTRWVAAWDTLQGASWDYSVWPYASEEANISWQQMLSQMLASGMSSIETYVQFASLLDSIISGDRPGYSSVYCPCDDGCSPPTSDITFNIFDGANGPTAGVKIYPLPELDTTTFGIAVYKWTPEQANSGITFILPYSGEVCLRNYNGDLYRTSVTAVQPSQLSLIVNGQTFTQGLTGGDEVNLFYNVDPDQSTVYFKLRTNESNDRTVYLDANFRCSVGVPS